MGLFAVWSVDTYAATSGRPPVALCGPLRRIVRLHLPYPFLFGADRLLWAGRGLFDLSESLGHAQGAAVARPGYRFYRGYWFPPAAFAAGVIVGRTLAHPVPPARRLTAAHIEWCFDHYRSYRAYDNTYQPYDGPREQCWSPYN